LHQQAIDNEQKNSLNTKSDNSSDIKVDLVEQDIPKLSYFHPSYAYGTNVKGKHVNLVFQLDTAVMNNIHDINQLNRDFLSSKALHTKVDYEICFTFRPRDFIENTLKKHKKISL
jgi:hypothetical protein